MIELVEQIQTLSSAQLGGKPGDDVGRGAGLLRPILAGEAAGHQDADSLPDGRQKVESQMFHPQLLAGGHILPEVKLHGKANRGILCV